MLAMNYTEAVLWALAPLRRPRPVAGYLVDHDGRRVVHLGVGITLLAGEARLSEHVLPARWFEASVAMISIEGRSARISEARSTNGAALNGVTLPLADWKSTSRDDVAALNQGGAAERIALLAPVWLELRLGDVIVTWFPTTSWMFHLA
jgi:hypothetical protein